MPKVSVIMAAYNMGEHLGEAIDSVLRQNFDDWELIIVNDCSTDNTVEVLKKYHDNSKIKVLHHQKNLGLTISCNDAIKASQGEYIVRLDADDYLDENALLVLTNILNKNPEIGLVYSDHLLVDDSGKVTEYVRRKKLYDEAKVLDLPPLSTGTMMRRQCFEELNGYNEEIRCQDTYDIWIKFINKFKAYCVNLPLWYYRKHADTLTTAQDRILETRKYVKEEFAKNNFARHRLKILGIIPARVKDDMGDYSCLKNLGDRPLLAYTVEAALQTKLLDKVVLTTEDATIAQAMSKYPVETILRPQSLAQPGTPIEPTVMYVLGKLKEQDYSPDIVALLYLNSPFRKEKHITEAINTLLIFDVDSVISVCEDSKFHYQHDIYGLRPLFTKRLVRLEKESLFEENGALCVSRASAITKDSLLGKKIGHVVMTREESIHIDSVFDFWLAEQILRKAASQQ